MAKQRRASSRPVRSKPADASPPAGLRSCASVCPRSRPAPRPGVSRSRRTLRTGRRRPSGARLLARILRPALGPCRGTPRRRSFTSACGSISMSASATWRRAQPPLARQRSGFSPPRSRSTPATTMRPSRTCASASAESPDHDHALYMLASVLVLRNELDEAVPVLLRAIELNPDNRSMARHDPDLGAAAPPRQRARRARNRPNPAEAPMRRRDTPPRHGSHA